LGHNRILDQGQILGQCRFLGQGQILGQGLILGQGHTFSQGHVQGRGVWLHLALPDGQCLCVCGCIWLRQMSLLTAPMAPLAD